MGSYSSQLARRNADNGKADFLAKRRVRDLAKCWVGDYTQR